MAKVDAQKFDALLTRLLKAKPAPQSSIKTSRKKKAGKIIPAPPQPNLGN
jgi:hypothetical protein